MNNDRDKILPDDTIVPDDYFRCSKCQSDIKEGVPYTAMLIQREALEYYPANGEQQRNITVLQSLTVAIYCYACSPFNSNLDNAPTL